MKKLFLALILAFAASYAHADGSPVFDVGYSTFITVGVAINSAPMGATLINSRPNGFSANVGMLRLTNSHPSWDVFIGDVNVSTGAYTNNVGQILKANGGTADWKINKDPKRNSVIVPLYARPADSASVDQNQLVHLSVTWFGF